MAGAACARCGSGEQLELDHVDPATKVSHRIWSWTKARLEAEIAKCQWLCRTCHIAKTLAERGLTPAAHGTTAMYVHHGCRCEACRTAERLYKRSITTPEKLARRRERDPRKGRRMKNSNKPQASEVVS